MKRIIASTLRTRLSALAQRHPEWGSWLVLCEATLQALDDPVWTALELRPGTERPANAPLLEGAELVLERSSVRAWLWRLSAITEREIGKRIAWSAATLDSTDAFAVLTATIQQDFARLRTLADAAHTETPLLQALTQLAVMPLLQACRHRLATRLPDTWVHGYCPCCGAWAVLAEQCGLERARHLRCGRCGAEWHTHWLCCPFCGETNHERLGLLVPEGEDESQSAATCTSCRGYIKILNTLQGAGPGAVMLDDLATVTLDVIAVERGYVRPRQPGYGVHVRLADRTPSRGSMLRRFT